MEAGTSKGRTSPCSVSSWPSVRTSSCSWYFRCRSAVKARAFKVNLDQLAFAAAERDRADLVASRESLLRDLLLPSEHMLYLRESQSDILDSTFLETAHLLLVLPELVPLELEAGPVRSACIHRRSAVLRARSLEDGPVLRSDLDGALRSTHASPALVVDVVCGVADGRPRWFRRTRFLPSLIDEGLAHARLIVNPAALLSFGRLSHGPKSIS